MFRKTRSEKFIEQAQDLVSEVADALAPRVTNAKDQLAPRVDTARERLVNDVVPVVQQRLAEAREQAREQATPVAEEARRRGLAATAALKGEAVVESKPSRKGRLLLLLGLLGLGALVAKRLQDQNRSEDTWQPSPAPATPTGPTGSSSAGSTSATPVGAGPAGTSLTDDVAGSAPDEALADATDLPHRATNPDEPADVIDLSGVEDPASTKGTDSGGKRKA